MSLGTEFIELNKTIHDRASFNCGENDLNLFIQKQASKHMQVGISKTMILPDTTLQENNKYKICAFYTIAPSSIKRESLPAKLAKKLPPLSCSSFFVGTNGYSHRLPRKRTMENHFNQSTRILMESQ